MRCSTRVVLPAPLGPSRATRSPCARSGRRRRAPGDRRGRRTPGPRPRAAARRHRTDPRDGGHDDRGGGRGQAIAQLRGTPRLVVDDGEDAVVAPGQHRQVHPLAPLVASGRTGRRPTTPPPGPARATAGRSPGEPGDPHAMHLAGDDVDVADHEAEIAVSTFGMRRRSRPRSSSARWSWRPARRGGTPSVPLTTMFHAAHSPLRQRQAEHVDPLAPAEERQEQGEDEERQLDRQPRSTRTGGAGDRRPHDDQRGVDAEGPERLPRRGHHGEDEQHGGRDLASGASRWTVMLPGGRGGGRGRPLRPGRAPRPRPLPVRRRRSGGRAASGGRTARARRRRSRPPR